jgi:hypothetical protein
MSAVSSRRLFSRFAILEDHCMTAPQPILGRSATASGKPRRRQDGELPPEYEGLVTCLEEAGATLLSLPRTGFSPALKTSALPILREATESYGWSAAEARPPMPSASRISRMDMVFGYLAFIPQDRYVLRRIIGCRALVHPISGRHLFSWRRLGEVLGADHKAIQRWHAEGIRIIIFALRRRAAEETAPPAEQARRTAQVQAVVGVARRLA